MVGSLGTRYETPQTPRFATGSAPEGRVYSFISSKGGLGSTALSVNLATVLAGANGGVAFCDMSLQSGDAAVHLDLVPKTGICDLCRNFSHLDLPLLWSVMARHRSGLDFLAAPMNPGESEEICDYHVSRIFALLKKIYRTVVVDCPSMSLGKCTIEALKASARIFIVTDQSLAAIRNAARLHQQIQHAGIAPDQVEFVVNRFTRQETPCLAEVEAVLSRKIFWVFPNDFKDIAQSINRGVPLVKALPKVEFSLNVLRFAEKLQALPKVGANSSDCSVASTTC